ncbi:hypothetical protein [Lysobacter gummosus]|uniref:hypothetical protein n=1 Tax=Lysobacter gummosus TaxID=262324 RepID=UPI00363A0FA3
MSPRRPVSAMPGTRTSSDICERTGSSSRAYIALGNMAQAADQRPAATTQMLRTPFATVVVYFNVRLNSS